MLEELHIYETYNGGAIYKVSVRDPEGEWHKIWAGTPHHVTQSRIFKPPLQVTTSKREDCAEALKNYRNPMQFFNWFIIKTIRMCLRQVSRNSTSSDLTEISLSSSTPMTV